MSNNGEVSEILFCTIVAQNYLPQALALYESLVEVSPKSRLVLLVLDGDRRDLEIDRPGLQVVGTDFLPITDREVLDLAMIYDVVEFATCIKPLLFSELLKESEVVVYLDPDMMVVSSLDELYSAATQHGVVLTPHFLEPVPPSASHIGEVHDLTVGVFNLGFVAVSRRGQGFLEWWWSHLRRECLKYPLMGMFVDQKWVDVGAVLFKAHHLGHYGYNVGPWNLHERVLVNKVGSTVIRRTGEPLRLLHFSGFNPNDPEAVSERLIADMRSLSAASEEFAALARRYAASVLRARVYLGEPPDYAYAVDASGAPISTRDRRTYRANLLKADERKHMPSPFLLTEVARYRKWKRRTVGSRFITTAADVALALKYVFPDQYGRVKTRFPGFRRVRANLLDGARVKG